MDNKEAISIITQIKGIITNDNSWSDVAKVAVKEACGLAIKALEEKPFEINVFLENADESTLFEIKKELARILTDRAEREAYAEARREAMRLDDNEDTYKWRGHA